MSFRPLASPSDQGFAPTINTPSLFSVANPRIFAIGVTVKLEARTVANTSAKASGINIAPSVRPIATSSVAKAVPMKTAIGRTKNMTAKTNSAIFGSLTKLLITGGVSVAVKITNTPDTSSTAIVSLNLRISTMAAYLVLAMVMPIAVTAKSPVSSASSLAST